MRATLSALQESGLVERSSDPNDGRQVIFRLKAVGRRVRVDASARKRRRNSGNELTRIPTPLTARQVIKRALRMEAAQLLRITAILALIAGLHSHGTA